MLKNLRTNPNTQLAAKQLSGFHCQRILDSKQRWSKWHKPQGQGHNQGLH